MNTHTQSLKGARTFALGMLAGASLVAGGLVLARGHNLSTPPAVMIQTSATGAAASNAASNAARNAATRQTSAELPPAIELQRAVVIGHRLKSLVRGEQISNPGTASTFIS